MAKHEAGTVRIIPADPTHMYHQINRYAVDWQIPADKQKPRRVNDAPMMKGVFETHAPGRHRAPEPEYWSMTCDGPCCV